MPARRAISPRRADGNPFCFPAALDSALRRGLDACPAAARRDCAELILFTALRAWCFACRRSLGRLPGAGQRGPVRGCARQSDAKHRVAGLGRHRRYGRRAERHGYQSLTARQSRDLLLISGRVDCVNTPAPLASPPKHPLRKVFNFHKMARATRLMLRELPSLAALVQVISLRAA